MNEFRLDNSDLSFALVAGKEKNCKACDHPKEAPIVLEAARAKLKVYDIKDSIQPSKYALEGDTFKHSNADGYEEILVENDDHRDRLSVYSAEDLSDLLMLIKDRTNSLSAYEFGKNLVISRRVGGHGYFDITITEIPHLNGGTCRVCQNTKNTANREIKKTENFVAFVPYSPHQEIEVEIAPIKHLKIGDMDSVLSFDLAGLIKRLLNAGKFETIALVEREYGHFTVKLYGRDVSNMEILGIRTINTEPELLAKALRERLSV
jgi:galactose-1-phosphate uridylyltransferase